jgi:hypothetical protein
MEISTLLIAVLVATMIATGLAAVILRFTRPKLLKSLDPSEGKLETPTAVGSPSDVRTRFITTPSGSIMVYIFCTAPTKTPVLGSPSENMTLLKIGSILQFQILPGSTSQPPKTQLVIQTQSERPNFETIPVAEFPYQKWVLLTIIKEGRRFTVYYNDKIVANSRTQYYPVINSSSLTIGHPSLKGKFIGPKIVPTAVRKDEVLAELQQTSDTRHEPYSAVSFMDIFNVKLGCPGGIFCPSTTIVPQMGPLQEWKSPYA